ncbi:MAG: KH domain-containing protein [Oscillospiraceae bacterium]|nr:KH domain-containing protein [Oscillospiraceae bacterium]
MKELLTYIAQSLVDNPDEVSVTEREEDTEIIYELRVNQSDMGKVIGRGGRIAKDIRSLMRSAAGRLGKRISVDIVD